MTIDLRTFKSVTAAAAMLWLAACAMSEPRPEGAAAVRDKLTALQADPELAGKAPLAMKEAEAAVVAAEAPRTREETDLSHHLVLMADRKVETASAQARARLLEDQRKALADQRETARLDSRTREADRARNDAADARSDARAARRDTDFARLDTAAARRQADELQRQLAEISAKPTERGLVVTLGDVMFASGAADLRGRTPGNLAKLATFLNEHPDRSVAIEGYTDSVGNPSANVALSQRRAEAVKSYLTGQGVASERLTAVGKGAASPVADNVSATGRQQNRRVEVVISDPMPRE